MSLNHRFRVIGAWTIDGTDQFVWIIAYDGPKSWQQADSDHYPQNVTLSTRIRRDTSLRPELD